MFPTSIESGVRHAPAVDRRFAFTAKPMQFAAAMTSAASVRPPTWTAT